MSKIPLGYIFKGLKALVLIILLTVVLNLFMTPGTPVASFGPFTLTAEGICNSTYMALRLIFLIIGTNIMTLTTSPIDLTMNGVLHQGIPHRPDDMPTNY